MAVKICLGLSTFLYNSQLRICRVLSKDSAAVSFNFQFFEIKNKTDGFFCFV